jgi:hypothetical protein
MDTFHEDLHIFMILYHQILLRMRTVQTKFVDKMKTHILCSITFYENCAMCEVIWKNMVEPDKPLMTI